MPQEAVTLDTKNTFRSCVYQHGDDRDFSLVSLGRRILAAGGTLTFDERYLRENWAHPNPFATPFTEIDIVPPSEIIDSDHRDALCSTLDPFDGPLTEYAQNLRSALINYLKAEWDATRPTLISHSAGYDSRILSLCMRDMAREGFDFGEIHFRCHQPENALFMEIMEREGWRPEQYSAWEGSAEDHYDIGRKARSVNGWVPYMMQMRWWPDIVTEAEEKDWNIMLGLGGGELFDYPARGIKPFTNYKRIENPFLNRWLNQFRYLQEWGADLQSRFKKCLLPYYAYEYLGLAARCRKDFLRIVHPRPDHKVDAVRYSVLGLFDLNLWDVRYGVHDYKWAVSEGRKREMAEAWESSRFRKDYGHLVGDANFLDRPDRHPAKVWGFMTVYDAIFGE